MEARRIEVTRYYACDGKEFDKIDECCDYEREVKEKLDNEIRISRREIANLKEKANERRLQFLLGQCDADRALKCGHLISFHMKMADYYERKSAYNRIMVDLSEERKVLRELIDRSYLWFGDREHKSSLAKVARMQMSLRWRQENTPDKWRTPNKIRVNKLPHPVRGKD